jgi:CxxC motif-containing protein (DUF1111 family)
MKARDLQPLLALAAFTVLGFGCRGLEPGDPLRGLKRAERAQFEHGRAQFARAFTPETGLGPLFNADACGECHESPVLGGVGDEVEVHAAEVRADGSCDALERQGGPVLQQHATPALTEALGIGSEPDPTGGARGRRTTPALFGRGLLDAVPDASILAYADPDDRDRDGISGRPNRFVDGRLGRFGRKAFVPTLREFNDGAFLFEQGITNPGAPKEDSIGGMPIPAGVDPAPDPEMREEDVAAANAFVRFLGIPAPIQPSSVRGSGRRLFERTGCAACHVPELRTGRSPVAALRHKRFAAYTDLLLHDLGPELADICLGDASPAEFRTEPLVGLRVVESFLHDGRAATIEEAIALHGGEASNSRDRFRALPERDRSALLAFLRSL